MQTFFEQEYSDLVPNGTYKFLWIFRLPKYRWAKYRETITFNNPAVVRVGGLTQTWYTNRGFKTQTQHWGVWVRDSAWLSSNSYSGEWFNQPVMVDNRNEEWVPFLSSMFAKTRELKAGRHAVGYYDKIYLENITYTCEEK